MSARRLSALDAAFLAVESPTAHMHVGWAAVFDPPPQRPRFEELREHIARRLSRAPRYRQKLSGVPLGLHHPEWIDDRYFDIGSHVVRSTATELGEVVDASMSEPLERDRPLWQMCIADCLGDGSIGVVGKAHHCMVDGVAAVELASLLLDPSPDAEDPADDGWVPAPSPSGPVRVAAAVLDRARDQLRLAAIPARIASSPRRVFSMGGQAQRVARALADSVRPAHPVDPLNEEISAARHLALVERPLADLRSIGKSFGVTINDAILAATAGGVRRFLRSRGATPTSLKTMVPVNVREDGDSGEYGNRISFMFIDLPCDEPDPLRRLEDIHLATSERKRAGEPQGADAVMRSITYAPHALQQLVSRLIASPRAFNLVVSNIPGPREPMYMRGCELRCAYPVVPIADHHALSVGMTTVGEHACFGLYTDRQSLPDADLLAEEVDQSIEELLRCARRPQRGADARLAAAALRTA